MRSSSVGPRAQWIRRLASLVAAWASATLPLPARAEVPARVALAPCTLKGGLQARCGTLEVMEDRQRPGGRKLGLRVVVVPALARAPAADPLFLLAGGPGQAASEAFPELIPVAFERVHRTRDLVLVDQRGTGASNPLRCHPVGHDAPLAERLREHHAFASEGLEACLRQYDADPRLYTTSIAMQDLDEVRSALGYGAINLWGASYGTRAALVYLREHGQWVRSAILDGVVPPTMRLSLHFAEDAQQALDRLFRACALEAPCAQAWPDLPGRFHRLLERLERAPAKVVVADPLTGAPEALTIERDVVAAVLRGVLYLPDQAVLVPWVIARAEVGDYGPLVTLAEGMGSAAREATAVGMMLSVLCAEDVPRITEAEAVEASRGTFTGEAPFRLFQKGCEVWPRGEVPPGFGEPVRSDTPVLLLSGEVDPVTPPRWAEEAGTTLPNSRHLVVPGVGHVASGIGCVPRLIAQFLDTGSPSALDSACVEGQKRPPFFVSFAGPTP